MYAGKVSGFFETRGLCVGCGWKPRLAAPRPAPVNLIGGGQRKGVIRAVDLSFSTRRNAELSRPSLFPKKCGLNAVVARNKPSTSRCRPDQDWWSALSRSLHLLQVSLVYVNTLMIQQVLTEPAWQGRLTAVDLRALSPLKWQHVNPYGTFTLDMNQRLPLEQMAFPCSAALPKFRASLP